MAIRGTIDLKLNRGKAFLKKVLVGRGPEKLVNRRPSFFPLSLPTTSVAIGCTLKYTFGRLRSIPNVNNLTKLLNVAFFALTVQNSSM